MLARWLDRELADGAEGSLSRAHAARIEQLRAERTRCALARSLDRLIERAQAPPRRRQITAILCGDQVREAEDIIRSIAARLRSGEPLDARGIAKLRTLLSDLTGACYVPSRPDALAVALSEVSRSLDIAG